MRTLLCLFAVAVPLAGAARADDVGVVVTGDAVFQPQLHSELEGWLSKHGHTLVAAPLDADAVNALIDCFVLEDDGCARMVVDKRARSGSVVFARAEAAHGSDAPRDVTIVAYWLRRGRQAVAEKRVCERCNDDSLRANTDEVIAALATVGQLDAGHLRLRSTPAGAHVAIDGQNVGVTPLAYELSPGDHTVAVTRAGNRVDTRTVAIHGGDTTNIDVALTPIDDDRGSRTLPLALAIGGGAALVTGGVLIAIDKSSDTSASAGKTVTRTLVPGIGCAIAGAAAIGAGAYLWFHRSAKSAPVAAVSQNGGYVGWIHTF
jgi:hypothetical protein